MSSRLTPSLLPLVILLAIFALMGLADLFLTWLLIQMGNGQVIESNPVANWWLSAYGWGGMTGYKVGTVLVVSVVVWGIARYRLRTAELLLVFACGAQSAILLHSGLLAGLIDNPDGQPMGALHWNGSIDLDSDNESRRFFRPGFLPENTHMSLLAHKAVHRELQLSEVHVREIARLSSQRRDLRMGFRNVSRDDWQTSVETLVAQEKSLLDDLESEQADRLQQIVWQQRGPFAFLDPAVSEALQLTSDQKAAVRAAIDESKKFGPGPFKGKGFGFDPRQFAEAAGRTKNRLLATLSADQIAKWRELTGQPFTVDLQPPGPPPGAGAFGRRTSTP